ncbi:MAG: hypothetical protein H6672_05605 [Anaerolineaceae bacterium]|nr:hypothetical protein [Anaerolineaceae bacterium]
MTPDIFNGIIVAVIIIGLALVVVRLYADFTRPLPHDEPDYQEGDTRPNQPFDDQP